MRNRLPCEWNLRAWLYVGAPHRGDGLHAAVERDADLKMGARFEQFADHSPVAD